jgi:hypothetical protein
MTVIICLGLSVYTSLEILIELAIVAWMWTGEASSGCPVLTEWNITLVELVCNTDAEESLTPLTEEHRLRTLDHTLFGENLLPCFVAS